MSIVDSADATCQHKSEVIRRAHGTTCLHERPNDADLRRSGEEKMQSNVDFDLGRRR
jgi:hypothetical protein